MHSEPQIALHLRETQRAGELRAVAAVLICVALPLVVFASSMADMSAIWWGSETYTHGFLVIPVFVYLVWLQRSELAAIPVRPAALALLGVLGAGLLWAMADLAVAPTPGYFALIFMAAASVIAVLGWGYGRALIFPLAFLVFAVPFGEAFIPTLMDWTADFTIGALRVSGIPVFREGNSFVIPSGRWTVAETCSGIRYLLASAFVGAVFARLMYRAWWKQAVFIAASLVVPIVANWLRAYMIVMLGHLSGNRVAVGVDHLLYGWLFFGLVMLLLFGIGGIWRETHSIVTATSTRLNFGQAMDRVAWWPAARMLAAALTIAVAWRVAPDVLSSWGDRRPVQLVRVEAEQGWRPSTNQSPAWVPALQAPAAMLTQDFEKAGRRVSLVIGVYRNQNSESKLVTSVHYLSRLLQPSWQPISDSREKLRLGQQTVGVNAVTARHGGESMLVRQWYWIRGTDMISDARAKLALAVDRLLLRSDTSAWVAIYSVDHVDGVEARLALQGFASEMGPSIERSLAEAAEK